MFNAIYLNSSIMLFIYTILKPVDCFAMKSNNCIFTLLWTSKTG